jgi:hypothetical protein
VCNGGSCVRDGVASFFYFSTYEYLKKAWTPKARLLCSPAPIASPFILSSQIFLILPPVAVYTQVH